MTSPTPIPVQVIPPEPRAEAAGDIIWGVVVGIIFALHIVFVIVQACPLWSICFPVTRFAPAFWSIVAFIVAVMMVMRARNTPNRRSIRASLAILLLLFAADSFTSGDFRWFEIGMRLKLQRCGGAAVLQAWAQSAVDSPPYSTAQVQGDVIDPKTLPIAIQRFASAICGRNEPLFNHNADGQLFFYFDDGGWDMGWGVVVGKTDLTNPRHSGIPQLHGWVKQMEPGIYIFSGD